jgi:2-(1,2-epoxy-1,2-dihydrophenyl)acetyl-CoA isomerase
MGSDLFKVEITDNIARCSMNSPGNMNALNTEMGYPMVEALGEVLADESVRVIILRGEGGHFCSGADLDLLGQDLDPPFLNQAMKAMGSIVYQLYTGPKPVITEVDGFAVGGGLGLALASDITYATERTLFCMGFIRIAAAPDMGSSYFLAERVGLARAKKMAFTGEVVGAEEALRIGLVNEVVDHQEISDKVMELARRIARRSAETLAWTKRVMNKYQRLELQSVLDLEAHVQPIMLLSEEHRAAVRKIMDRWLQKNEGDQ